MDLRASQDGSQALSGVFQRAFGPGTDPGRLFCSRLMGPVSKEILAGRSIVVIKGAPGSGKTSFMQLLALELRPRQLDVAIVAVPGATPADVQASLRQTGRLTGEQGDPAALLRALWHEAGLKRLVLLCDNAETLPADTFHVLAQLLKQRVTQPIALQIVLVGEAGAWPGLAGSGLEVLREAAESSYTTLSLQPEEATAYLDHRLRQAGRTLAGVMTRRAAAALRDQAHGNARRLDALALRALLHGHRTGHKRLTSRLVRQSLREEGAAAPPRPHAGWTRAAAAAAAICLLAGGGLAAWLERGQDHAPPPPPARLAGPVAVDAPPPRQTAALIPRPTSPVPPTPSPSAATARLAAAAPQPPPASAPQPAARRAETGLVLIAGPHDTMPALYARVYRGLRPPPYADVLAVNQHPVRPGTLLIFPAPPLGWTAR